MTTLRPSAPQLRPYQRAAVDAAVQWHATHTGHCLIVVPTGGGKSLILGTLAHEAVEVGARVLILAHRGELIAQNAAAAMRVTDPSRVGVVSGAEKRPRAITVATVQTFGRKPYAYGAFDLVLVDEAHLIPHGSDGLYHKTFAALRTMAPNMRVIGLTATPYRLTSGRLDEGKGALFDAIAYECDLLELLRDGYLCPLRSLAGKASINVAGVSTRGGEFIAGALEQRVDAPEATAAIVAESVELAGDRKKWLIFAAGVQHAEHLAEAFTAAGIPTQAVHGTLSAAERATRLAAFKAGELRALTNCDLLTTGFDAPDIDCLVIARPTLSPGLHVQILGRGLRTHPSKTDTVVLDFAGNCLRHGPLDAIQPPRAASEKKAAPPPAQRVCSACQTIAPTIARVCPGCGVEFPPPPPAKLFPGAVGAPALSLEPEPPQWQPVTSVEYERWVPRQEGKRDTLRVTYLYHYRPVASEWICVEHEGFARTKAEDWWRRRHPDAPLPATIDDALARTAELATPLEIALQRDGKWDRVVDYRFTATPSLPKACWSCGHWTGVTCSYWNDTPPAPVQQQGCDEWTAEDLLPF